MKFYLNKPLNPHAATPDTQDRNYDAWFKLLELIDKAAEDKRPVFNPSKELGREIWNQITVLPKAIKKLKDVKHLALYGSNLVRIPPEIGEMESLEKFTPYTSYGLKWFPFEITKCKFLKDSTVSTRAIYGNFKFRTIFPDLTQYPIEYYGGNTKCSICGNSEPKEGFNQVWVSRWVATDVLPLLANVCSEKCLNALPKGEDGYLPFPHKGGKNLHQPFTNYREFKRDYYDYKLPDNAFPNFKPALDKGDFYQFKENQFCWFLLSPIANLVYHSKNKEAVIEQLSDGQRALYYWWFLESTVGYMGFEFFFQNGFAEYLPNLIEGAKTIGNQALAELLEELNHQLKIEGNECLIDDSILKKYSDAYFDLTYHKPNLFEDYIRNHPKEFLVDENGNQFDKNLTGSFKTYFPSSQLKNEFSTQKGILEGIFKVWSEDGVLLKDEFYEHGILVTYIYYDKNGLKTKEVNRFNEGTVMIEYSPPGRKRGEKQFNVGGELHGHYHLYYQNGLIHFDWEYENGIRIKGKEYYKNGELMKSSALINQETRVLKFWDRNGKLTVEDGDGFSIYVNDNPTINEKIITEYLEGLIHGKSTHYRNDKIVYERTYQYGKLHGEFKMYENGKLRTIEYYENNQKIGEKNFES